MAAHGLPYARWQAVLRRDLFSSERWIWAPELSAGAAEHCQRVQGKTWRRDRAGKNGRGRDCTIGILSGTRWTSVGGRGRRDSGIGDKNVRRPKWRVWKCSKVD